MSSTVHESTLPADKTVEHSPAQTALVKAAFTGAVRGLQFAEDAYDRGEHDVAIIGFAEASLAVLKEALTCSA